MTKSRPCGVMLLLLLLSLCVAGMTGCGTYMAHRIVQSPNSYPQWVGPEAPVLLDYSPRFLTNFPREFVTVGPPAARLCYRVIPPGDYDLTVSATNWFEHGKQRTEYKFSATVPAPTNHWTANPRGTVVLLHGYALAQFIMAPWALRLAQDGWRCVLVDLRGHGRSTGDRIYFGLREPADLGQLLDELARHGQLRPPVAAMGESYGAVMALRWKPIDSRIAAVVAIAPYAGLSNTVMNLRAEYAPWLPKWLIRAGLKKLPGTLGVPASQLDTMPILQRSRETALFIAAGKDKIAPVDDVAELRALATPESRLLVLPEATHETVPFRFSDLTGPVLDWLRTNTTSGSAQATPAAHGAVTPR